MFEDYCHMVCNTIEMLPHNIISHSHHYEFYMLLQVSTAHMASTGRVSL